MEIRLTLWMLCLAVPTMTLGSTGQGLTADNVMVIKEDFDKVLLRCGAITNDTGPAFVQWEYTTDNTRIITRDSDNKINPGSNFTGTVALQENGDLLLYSPRRRNSGIYSCQRHSTQGNHTLATYVYLMVNKAVSEAMETRSTIIVILMAIDIVLLDINIFLLLTHCEVYRKHKDIWSLRLFFLAYYIIYGATGLVLLMLYVMGRKSDFLFNVGSTCSATSVPPICILWIDFVIIVHRANKRRSGRSGDNVLEDMRPVIRAPGHLSNRENGGRDSDETRLRKRFHIQDRPARKSTCCSWQTDDGDGTESVELTGHVVSHTT